MWSDDESSGTAAVGARQRTLHAELIEVVSAEVKRRVT